MFCHWWQAVQKNSFIRFPPMAVLPILSVKEPWQTVQLLAKALGVDCREFADEDIEMP
jgi:hypothetical protein